MEVQGHRIYSDQPDTNSSYDKSLEELHQQQDACKQQLSETWPDTKEWLAGKKDRSLE